MFLFFAVVAGALALAVLIGGDVRRLSHVRVHHLGLLIAALGFKALVAGLSYTQSLLAVAAARPLTLLGAVLLLLATWFNRRLPGAWVFGAGLLSNLVAIASFGGRMPILLPAAFEPTPGGALPLLRAGLDPLHVLLLGPQGLWFLGDIFLVPGIVGRTSLVSIGDLLMATGVAYFIIRWSQLPGRAPKIEPSPAK